MAPLKDLTQQWTAVLRTQFAQPSLTLHLAAGGTRVAEGDDPIATRERERAMAQQLERSLTRIGMGTLTRSHSHGVALIGGVSGARGLRLGIDFEFADRAVAPTVEAKYVAPEEKALALPALQIWTLKEAALKSLGRDAVPHAIPSWRVTGAEGAGWRLRHALGSPWALSSRVALEQGEVWLAIAVLSTS